MNRLIKSGCLVMIGGLTCFLASCGSYGSGSAPTTLRIWQTETDKDAVKVLQQMADRFQVDHPGVKVEVESVGWSSLGSKLMIAVRTNNVPDLAHVEPFMAASLVQRGLLLPIDDVIETLKADVQHGGNGTIYPGVLDLQKFNGRRYGIAYAVGTTGFAYRKDIAKQLHLTEPKTWKEYIRFARRMKDRGLPVLLPGADPFFVDQLFAELVANNGGKLFDADVDPPKPLMMSKQVRETLQFFSDLRESVDSRWTTQPYLDQFNRFARGEAGNVPVTYARAYRAIEAAGVNKSLPVGVMPTPEFFAWMQQPRGPSLVGDTIATIDCEPFVVFRSAETRKHGGKTHADYAKEFLSKYFYKRADYLSFVNSVPIHLTPVFEQLSRSPEYQNGPVIHRWKSWEQQTAALLSTGRTRPILMPDASEKGRSLRLLLEMQNQKILTDAVTDVVSRGRSVDQTAKAVQDRCERLVKIIYGRN